MATARLNATISKPNTLAGRPLSPEGVYKNPAMFAGGAYSVVVTKFADGELLLEAVDRSLTGGWCRRTTEAALGLTYAELLDHVGEEASTFKPLVGADAISIVIGPSAGKQLLAVRAFLVFDVVADPLPIGLKLLAIKAQRKYSKMLLAMDAEEGGGERTLRACTAAQLAALMARLSAK
jgi:hypothetical protein